MNKEWVRLFQIIQRCDLEMSLNQFVRDHDVKEIKVWTNSGNWYALVRYSYHQEPTYPKHDKDLDE